MQMWTIMHRFTNVPTLYNETKAEVMRPMKKAGRIALTCDACILCHCNCVFYHWMLANLTFLFCHISSIGFVGSYWKGIHYGPLQILCFESTKHSYIERKKSYIKRWINNCFIIASQPSESELNSLNLLCTSVHCSFSSILCKTSQARLGLHGAATIFQFDWGQDSDWATPHYLRCCFEPICVQS